VKSNLKSIFLIVFIVSIILGSPILLNRLNTEKHNNIYEIGISAQSILHLNKNQMNEFYNKMNKVEVSTLIFDNINFYELEKYRKIEIDTVNDFLEKDNYELSKRIPEDSKKENIIITLNKKDFIKDEIQIIEEYLKNYKILEKEDIILFYIDKPKTIRSDGQDIINPILTTPFFIDQKSIQECVNKNLNAVIGVLNPNEDEIQKIILNQVLNIKEKFDVNQVQLRGDSVFGYPNNTRKYFVKMQDKGISILLTEFQTNIGLSEYSTLNNGSITRAHEISVDELKLSNQDLGARISRAIKERNMRFIALRNFIDYKDDNSVEKSINNLYQSINIAKSQIGSEFESGYIKPVPIMKKNTISEILIGISFSALVGALILSLNNKYTKLSLLLFAITLITSLITVLLGTNILVKIYAFIVSIVGASSAIIIPYNIKNKSYITKYLLSFLLAILTGIMISSIMYGTDYILKLKSFSGVKLLYILPLMIIAIWTIITSETFSWKNIKSLNEIKGRLIVTIKNMKLYHYIIVFIVIIGAYMYISRSGNSGSAGELELQIRALMERVLYARPRTKEFILGYPALFIAYYLYYKTKNKYSKYILILGAMGTMSTVNTFTHLHTPFLYSLLRSIYGVLFGAIVGIIYILIFKIIQKNIHKFIREE